MSVALYSFCSGSCGRGCVRLLRKHSDTFSLASFIPALFLAGVVCGLVVSFFSPGLRLVYAFVLGLYWSVVVGVSVLVAIRAGNVRILPWLPFVFATVHAGAGYGVLAEVVAGKPIKKCGCE